MNSQPLLPSITAEVFAKKRKARLAHVVYAVWRWSGSYGWGNPKHFHYSMHEAESEADEILRHGTYTEALIVKVALPGAEVAE